MPAVPISDLPAASALTVADEFLVTQGGASKAATLQRVADGVAALWTPYDRLILKTPNLAGYWPLDEVAGIRATDVKGGNHGTYVSTPVLAGAGPLASEASRAPLFNGSTQWVTAPYAAALDPHPQITVEAWIRTPSGGAMSIVTLFQSSTYGYLMELQSSGQLAGWLMGNATSITYTSTGVDLRDNLWHHVALVGTPTTLDLHTDGSVVHHVDGTYTWYTASAATWYIGARSATQGFNGSIARVAVYSRALPVGELASHNAAGRS